MIILQNRKKAGKKAATNYEKCIFAIWFKFSY